MCFAIAVSEPADVLGWAVAPDPQQARTGAHQHCIDGGGGRACRVTDSECNGNSADLATATPGAPAATPTPSEVMYGARCGEAHTGQRDCWAEVPGHSGCYAWFGRIVRRGTTFPPSIPPSGGSRFDAYTWEGQCLNGLAHGHWVLARQFEEIRSQHGHFTELDEITQGSFVEGKRHGFWERRRPPFDSAEANFVNGRLHGELRQDYLGNSETLRFHFVHGEWQD